MKVVNLKEYYTPNSEIHFVWLKVVFKSNIEVCGLDEFLRLGMQFYLTDLGSGKPKSLTFEDCKEPVAARKEAQLHGVLNDLHYTAEEGDMQVAYIKMRLRKKYGSAIKSTESGDEDRSPTK
jgi:hypothetical protein